MRIALLCLLPKKVFEQTTYCALLVRRGARETLSLSAASLATLEPSRTCLSLEARMAAERGVHAMNMLSVAEG